MLLPIVQSQIMKVNPEKPATTEEGREDQRDC
jgi:hypothetical protein